MFRTFVAGLLTISWAASAVGADAADEQFFEREIRPLLAARCVTCHGRNGKTEGGLRFTSREAVLKGGGRGAALVPRDAERSLLLKAVRRSGDLKMPPEEPLPEREIALLARWIAGGAAWGAEAEEEPDGPATAAELWALRPVARPAIPEVTQTAWVQTPVDRFILARLEAADLSPAPPADRRTLLRRATYDLIGLPPTPEEVAAFVADDAPDAWPRVVERLLASPHYGEKWGRHWLDVARYADSSGKDENHAVANAFRYRDYVVAAFNADLPYDQFLREQLAGDLLPAASEAERLRQLTATGFLQLGPKALAEQDKPRLLFDIMDEQLDVIGRGLLGLTITCSRCHDHKFDPLSQHDYYALGGILRSTKSMQDLAFVSAWYEAPLATPEHVAEVAARKATFEEAKQALDVRTQQAQATLSAALRRDFAKYLLAASRLTLAERTPTAEVVQQTAREQRLLAATLTRFVELRRTAQKQPDGLFALWEQLIAVDETPFANEARARIAAYVATPPNSDAARLAAAAFRDAVPASLADAAALYEKLAAEVDAAWQLAQNPAEGQPMHDKLADPAREQFRQLLYGANGLAVAPPDGRSAWTPEDEQAVKNLEQGRDAAQARVLPDVPTTLAVTDGEVQDLAVHLRGNHLQLGAKAPRGFIEAVAVRDPPAIPTHASGRRELADWLTRPDHPLTSRVIVNRVWQWHFGRGLSATSDNFGARGEPPTHPELLDWLAAEFAQPGDASPAWSFKALHRRILLSSTYQMSSRIDPATATVDPENRLWSRFARRRLEAEEVRDSLLAVSGQLDPALGGNLFNYANREPHVTYYKGPVNYNFPRRTLYLPVVRNAMYDLFELFNGADPLVTTPRRETTTVAPQALYFMNADTVQQSARILIAGTPAGGREARLHALYQRVFQRPAAPAELVRGLAFLERAEKIIVSGNPQQAEEIAWTALAQALLSANEFVYLD